MEYYRHTQLLHWSITLTIAIAVLVTGYIGITQSLTFSLVVAIVFLLAFLLFPSLTVIVDRESVLVYFGFGLIRKRVALAKISACRPVRNKWYYGWGIRLIPSGWMFNVAGLDAVELALADGGAFRIGTDESDRLSIVITQRLQEAKQPSSV
jgi:hypothetical protein